MRSPLSRPDAPGTLCGWRAGGARAYCDDAQSLWLAGIAALITATAHHIYFPIITLAILAAIGLWLTDRPATKDPAPRHWGTCARAHSRFRTLLSSRVRFHARGVCRAARCIFAVLRRCLEVRNSRVPGVVACDLHIRHRWPRHLSTKARRPSWLLAVSLVAPAGLLFLVSGQPRLLPPILAGTGIAAGRCVKLVASIGPQVRAAALLLALTIAATLLVPADRATAQYTDFYRVVDESLMRAATAIESDAGSGAVAVREDRRGWPIGW